MVSKVTEDLARTLELMKELNRNANLGKCSHFHAAGLNQSLNLWMGVPVIIINIALGSAFFYALTQELPWFTKWMGGFLGLGAAAAGSLQTLLGFGRKFEGHRKIANKYLSLARDVEFLQAQFDDKQISPRALSRQLRSLLDQYQAINVEAEAFPTGSRNFSFALKSEEQRQHWKSKQRSENGGLISGDTDSTTKGKDQSGSDREQREGKNPESPHNPAAQPDSYAAG